MTENNMEKGTEQVPVLAKSHKKILLVLCLIATVGVIAAALFMNGVFDPQEIKDIRTMIAEGKYNEAKDAIDDAWYTEDTSLKKKLYTLKISIRKKQGVISSTTDTFSEEDGSTYAQSTVYENDSNGNQTKWSLLNDDGTVYSYGSITYDQYGNQLEEDVYEDENLTSQTEYTYDSLGRLTTKTNYGEDETVTTTYEYDNANHLIAKHIPSSIYAIEGTYSYDDKDHLISEKEIHTYDGIIKNVTVSYEYDEDGNLSKEMTEIYKDGTLTYTSEYTYKYQYDSNHLLQTKSKYSGDTLSMIYQYDENGNETTVTVVDDNGDSQMVTAKTYTLIS